MLIPSRFDSPAFRSFVIVRQRATKPILGLQGHWHCLLAVISEEGPPQGRFLSTSRYIARRTNARYRSWMPFVDPGRTQPCRC